jgi:hypothetical protein
MQAARDAIWRDRCGTGDGVGCELIAGLFAGMREESLSWRRLDFAAAGLIERTSDKEMTDWQLR